MGKYGNIQLKEIENQGQFEVRMLQGVANELSKLNDLKILEIQINNLSNNVTTINKVTGTYVDSDKVDNILKELSKE